APSAASTIGKAAIVVLVMFSYPLQVHPCRASVDAVLKWRPSSFRSRSSSPMRASLLNPAKPSGAKQSPDSMSEVQFAAITTVIIVLSYVVAMTVSSLEKVLAYVGSTGSTSISFILPGLFYYKISSPSSPHHQRLMKEDDDEEDYDSDQDSNEERADRWLGGRHWRAMLLRRLSLALAVYGGVVMVVCLVTNTFLIAAH
ncbi:hypothetical protein LTR39_004065, partial [Cryomyces antarcticus]